MCRAAQLSERAAAPVVLAIETSTEIGSVALVRGGKTLAEAHHVGGPELSAWVLPAIERLLHEIGLAQPDAVACGIGPGAFTGVRTACATAQALAWGWSVPLHAVGSLDAFLVTHFAHALDEAESTTSRRWAVLMDARQAETYATVWEVSESRIDSLSPRERVGVRAGLEAEPDALRDPHPALRAGLSHGERLADFGGSLSPRERAGVRAALKAPPDGGAAPHPALRAGLSHGERQRDAAGTDWPPTRMFLPRLRRVVAPTLVADAVLAAWLAEHGVQHALGSACAKLDGEGPHGIPSLQLERVLKHAALGVGMAATLPSTRVEVDPLDLQPLYVRDRVALTEAERAANRHGLAAPSSAVGVS